MKLALLVLFLIQKQLLKGISIESGVGGVRFNAFLLWMGGGGWHDAYVFWERGIEVICTVGRGIHVFGVLGVSIFIWNFI